MITRLAADAVLLLHGAFVLFVTVGGIAVLRWPRLAFLHLPAVAWAILVEAAGLFCPLTTLENLLRRSAGQQGYSESFIEHYLWPALYPAGLTRGLQWTLALVVLAINAVIYVLLWRRLSKRAENE